MSIRNVAFLCLLLLLFGCTKIEEVFEDISSIEENNHHEVVEFKTHAPSYEPSDSLNVKEKLLPMGNSRKRTAAITHVMIHFTSNVLNDNKDPYRIEDIYSIFEQYQVSAHYIIDRDGTIYLFVGEDRVAYHAGKGNVISEVFNIASMNDKSIGIELLAIGTKEEMVPLITEEAYDKLDSSFIGYTDEQYSALQTLITDILSRHNTIKRDREHIIGHNEYAPVRKPDPGMLFDWTRLEFHYN
ncbi:MAG: N-acetylmuramoyl-L-alanine amidase [Bacillaceae bacterium]|nr:N-acetylmuramoyl-L-alanine amidase [Bacillaceae bacterium]